MEVSVFGICSCREDWVDIVMTLRIDISLVWGSTLG